MCQSKTVENWFHVYIYKMLLTEALRIKGLSVIELTSLCVVSVQVSYPQNVGQLMLTATAPCRACVDCQVVSAAGCEALG